MLTEGKKTTKYSLSSKAVLFIASNQKKLVILPPLINMLGIRKNKVLPHS